MDSGEYEELKGLLERLTHSGSPMPGEPDVKKLKTLCRKSESCVRSAHELLMVHLGEGHAEVRLSAHDLVEQLFQRSHTFRECLVDTFQEYLALAVGVDAERPLPPPAGAAKLLKARTLLSIKRWTEAYGAGYPKLKLSYNYLKYNLRVDFDNLVAQSQAERRRVELQQQVQTAAAERRLAALRTSFTESEEEVESTLTQMDSCFKLLFPRLDGPDLYQSSPVVSCGSPVEAKDDSDRTKESDSDSDSDSEWVDVPDDSHTSLIEGEGQSGPSPSGGLQAHGIPAQSYSVTVELPKSGRVVIEEAEDNSVILNTLRDCEHVVRSSLLPDCSRTIESLAKLDGAARDLRLALERRSRLQAALQKYKELKIVDGKESHDVSEKTGSSSKGGCQHSRAGGEQIATHADGRTEWAFIKPLSALDEVDPTSLAAQLKARQQKIDLAPPWCSGSHDNSQGTTQMQTPAAAELGRKAGLLAQAPVVPFGTDLLHWDRPEERVGPTPAVLQFESLHRFWSPRDCEVKVPQGDNHRIIPFAGQFEPVDRPCGAPLPGGRLCPRRDREKCPFHGAIVPRDEHGTPLAAIQRPPENDSSSAGHRKDWEQVGVEVGQALGVDLSLPDRKGKGRKGRATRKKYPGLTDLKTLHNTPRKRLERIVLSRKSLERVARSVDQLEQRKFDDKFGNNYNYALN